MFKEADAEVLKRRLLIAVLLLAGLAAAAAVSSAAGTFRDTQAALVAVAIVTFLILAASGAPIRLSRAQWAMGLFILVSAGAATASIWRSESLLEVGLFYGYLMVLVAAANAGGGRRLRLAAHLLVGAAVFIAVSALYAYMVGYDRQIQELAAHGRGELARQLAGMAGRAFGTFPSANSLAGFLILFIPIAVGLWLREKDKRLKVWVALAALLLSAAVILTFSKGALLALAAGLGLMIYGRVPAGRLGARLFLPTTIGLLATLYISWSFFDFSLPAALANVSGRLELWQSAYAIAVRHPILGIGPGAFGTALPAAQKGAVYARYAHNTYLQVFAELGLAGLLSFLLLIGAILQRGWRLMVDDLSDDKWLRLGCLGGLTAFLVHNLVDYTWYVPGVAFAFWLIAGLTLAETAGGAGVGARPAAPRRALVGVAALTVIPALIVYAGSAQVARANYLAADQRFSEAAAAYRRGLRIFPFSAEAYDGLARAVHYQALANKRQFDPRAIEYQRRAIELRPGWPHYHARLADYLAGAGRRQEAIDEYVLAGKLYPLDPQFKVRLGSYLLALRRPKAAAAAFQEGARLAGIYRARNWSYRSAKTARGDERAPIIAIGNAYKGLAISYTLMGRRAEAKSMLVKAERILGPGREMEEIKRAATSR